MPPAKAHNDTGLYIHTIELRDALLERKLLSPAVDRVIMMLSRDDVEPSITHCGKCRHGKPYRGDRTVIACTIDGRVHGRGFYCMNSSIAITGDSEYHMNGKEEGR